MATTKKITDLNKTTTVGNSDLLVLAQSGQQEAQSATVGALVDKVATQISDGALIEHLAGLSKQKQLLAKALTDKGVKGITEKSTLDEMAAEIKDLDVVGSQDKVVFELYNQLNTIVDNLSKRISSAQARVLCEHNAIISRTSAGVFGIFKLAVDGTLTEIASCDCNDFVPTPSTNKYCRFGFSKDEQHIAWYDATLKKLILFHMDWETNTLTRTLAYTVTTANIGTSGNYEYIASSQYGLLGVVPASDGSKVCLLSNNKNNYIHATVVDVATQTEVTNIGKNANAANVTEKIFFGFWHWDIETGIIKGGTSYYPLFEFTLDLSGDIPFMSFGGYRITRMGNYTDTYYGMPYFLWEKGLMLQLAMSGGSYSSEEKPIGYYGTLWLRDIETGRALDSVDVYLATGFATDKSHSTTSTFYAGISTSNSASSSPVVVKKDGKIIVGFGMYMRFELDEENKKLIPYKHNGAKDANGRYPAFSMRLSGTGIQGYVPGNYIYCNDNPDLIFAIHSADKYGECETEEYTAVYCREEPCVMVLILHRNGKKKIMDNIFSYTEYKAGAYAEKDEVEYLNLSESEG